MKQVTKEEFFAIVGPRDINPRVDVATLRNRHHVSNWEDRSRLQVGRTVSDSWGIQATQFFLIEREA
jgi:hypothetical protein